MPEKKKVMRKRDPKYKKEEIKNQKIKKKLLRLKNRDPPPGKTHKLMEKFLNEKILPSQLLLRLKTPYMQRGRYFYSLSRRPLC
jgi:hypothetical protein